MSKVIYDDWAKQTETFIYFLPQKDTQEKVPKTWMSMSDKSKSSKRK